MFMAKYRSKRFIVTLLLVILVSSLITLYFLPVEVNDQITIWLSNHRFEGFIGNETALFLFSDIGSSQMSNTIEWSGNGLKADISIENISSISLCEGLLMWANDSLNRFHYPVVSEGNQDPNIHLNVLSVSAEASRGNTSPTQITYFDNGIKSKAYAFVDLNQTEATLGIKGNESYRLSINMVLDYYLNIPTPLFHSNSSSKIVAEKTVSLGEVIINCTNGMHTSAHVDLPYQSYSYNISVPFIETIFPF
jgi:hypothetical protein